MSAQADIRRNGVPFRTRLLISSLLGAVPLFVFGILLLISRYQARRDVILQANLTIAQVAAESVAGWLDGNIRTLRTLASSAEAQSGNVKEIAGLVMRQQATQPDWENLSVTDAEGRIIASGHPSMANLSDRPFFQQTRRTLQPAISNLLISRVTGNKVFVIAVPIIQHGHFHGIVSVAIRPESIRRLFTSHLITTPGTNISLWGNDRRLITASDMGPLQVGWQYNGSELSPIFRRQRGDLIANDPLSNTRMLFGYAAVGAAPWVVVAGTPLSIALGPIYRDSAIFLLLSALILAITIWWSYYSATAQGRVVAELAKHAREIGAGRVTPPIEIHTGDELEDLANSLNQMAINLAALDRLKSELITMVSHELKTPLTGIRAALDLLTSGALAPDSPSYQETLAIAERQSRRLQDMIDNLINVSRLQSGGLIVTPRPAALSGIIRAATQQYRGVILDHGLELKIEAPEDLQVMADVPKVTLALNNLLDNAVKFTDKGGITVRAIREGDQAVVTVTDTGTGFPPEVRDRLFSQFYQAEPLLTRRASGVGLGLWVTHAVIEAHGGSVFAESEGVGKGATFGFTLPLAPSA